MVQIGLITLVRGIFLPLAADKKYLIGYCQKGFFEDIRNYYHTSCVQYLSLSRYN